MKVIWCLSLVVLMMNKSFCLEEKKAPKVVVVGAGIAGLTAAHRLKTGDMDVEVYEARNRAGGRIFSVQLEGAIAELGAMNITDGGDAVHLHRLIREFELGLIESSVLIDHSFLENDQIIPFKKLLKEKNIDPEALRDKIDFLKSTKSNMKEILDGLFEASDPVYRIVEARLAAYEGDIPEKLSTLYSETLYHIILGGICTVHQGSLEEETRVELLSIEGGNGLLTNKLAGAIGENIYLNMPLKKVSKSSENSYELTFENGKVVEADLLVLAIPASTYVDIDFGDNVLPVEKLNNIRSIAYGRNAKILVPYSDKAPEQTGFIQDGLIAFFDRVRSCITLFYSGDQSQFSKDNLQMAYDRARSIIEKHFKGDIAPFKASYAEDEDFQSYGQSVGYSWPNDPYVKGTYSYIAPGQEALLTSIREEKGELVKTLFAPIDGRLYFAGEHTSILMEVPGTMESAAESGERVARMILKLRK